MKRQLPPALGVFSLLLVGVAGGFAHRVHDQGIEVRRIPVVHAAACLEALVLLRQERPAEAARVLRRHRREALGGRRGGGRERANPFVRERLGAVTPPRGRRPGLAAAGGPSGRVLP